MKLLTNNQSIINSLSKIDVHDSFELIEVLPYKYEDYTYSNEYEIKDNDKVTLLVKLVSNCSHVHTPKIDIISFFAVSINSSKMYSFKIYNRVFYKTMLNMNDEFTIQGTYNQKKNLISVITIKKGYLIEEKKYKPVYHLPSDLSQNTFISLIRKTLEIPEMVFPYDVPKMFLNKYKLEKKINALKLIHIPTSQEDIKRGLRTIKYSECLEFCLKNSLIKKENKRVVLSKNKIPDLKVINSFISNLKYKLTHDQIIAIKEIILDMNSSSLMYRLLQGDVGTGKTIVAITCLYANYLRNNIGAFMVPTDTLAKQQYNEVKELFSSYNINVELLIGSMTLKEKRIIKDKLKNGEIDVLVGTHALFSDDVEYPNLGLCIIDEQHRFGVNQRSKLVSKGDKCDLLLMTATPIPRTLSIALYGDLDVSTLKMYPKEKNPVHTQVVKDSSALIYSTIDEMLNQNRQVFIIAPKITENDNIYSVESLFKNFSSIYKEEVQMLNGKMKSKEKDEVLENFKNGNKKILISTTVVELGLNVLTAGAIIIYSASNFGLASLHQLRGRVGRDSQEAICLLVDNNDDERLLLLEKIHAGDELAYEDLKNRGAGDFFGSKQSGFPTFRTVNVVDDFKMFMCAKEDATYILNHLEQIEFERLVLHVKNKMIKEEKEELILIDA